MAIRGQRFTLDPEADNFTFNIDENESYEEGDTGSSDFVKEITEREPTGIPPPPKQKQTKTGFPLHRPRNNVSAFKLRQQQRAGSDGDAIPAPSSHREPSDRAILNHIGRKYGIDTESREKAEKTDISEENKRRIAKMSKDDIEEARSEIMSSFSPAFIERLLKRANIDEDKTDQDWDNSDSHEDQETRGQNSEKRDKKKVSFATVLPEEEVVTDEVLSTQQPFDSSTDNIEPQFREIAPSLHFPVPPRDAKNFVPLDPDSPSFLSDLKKHYFPELPDDPSTLAWLQDPTEEESEESPYAPTRSRYAPSDIRFGFTGRLIAPNDSRDIPVSKGLHHHGHAPESAGYTIPELSILARSSLPNQRCIAYQVLGRILYRLGRGDFGQRGSELQEGLWVCVEKERPIEVMMSEANRTGGHVSAKAYATEALWLWRKGGGGERGVLKSGEKLAK